METMFSVGSALRLYDNPRPAERELREPLEMELKYDGGEVARKELGCAKKT
jgi:hypothetical protein